MKKALITLNDGFLQFKSIRKTNNVLSSNVFYLYKGFMIDYLLCDGKKVHFTEAYRNIPFKPYAKTLILENANYQELEIAYHGTINEDLQHYNNCIRDELILLTDYAPWFPTFPEDELDQKIQISFQGFQGFHNLQGEILTDFESEEASMVLLHKNYQIDRFKTPSLYLNVIYKHAYKRSASSFIANSAQDILVFHQSLFGSLQTQHFDISFFATGFPINDGWQFIRDGVIVSNDFLKDEIELSHLLAHELGHLWSHGAPLNWEDWLNETFAEYAALLFLESRYGNQIYNSIIEAKKQMNFQMFNDVPIKTIDGSRPNNVHLHGTILFDNIRKMFGYQTIVLLFQTFQQLGEKNTVQLISEIIKNDHIAVAKYLENYIYKTH